MTVRSPDADDDWYEPWTAHRDARIALMKAVQQDCAQWTPPKPIIFFVIVKDGRQEFTRRIESPQLPPDGERCMQEAVKRVDLTRILNRPKYEYRVVIPFFASEMLDQL
jgi:hypothetical protein